MTLNLPHKVLLTRGHEVGGLNAFAEALAEGFTAHGIPTEIIPPMQIYSRLGDLRNPNILKILSTTSVFAAPMARRAICVAHGSPCVDVQGWAKFLGFLVSYKIANWSPDAPLVAVSEYCAIHMVQLFNLRFDDVIRNPVKSIFLEATPSSDTERNYITYVGRLTAAKNVHLILPAIQTVLAEDPSLRACIIGDGDQRAQLEEAFSDDRIEFAGNLSSSAVRDFLRKTRVFVSCNQTEPFGITFLEALSQGCAVAMPASGGGLEIRPDLIGSQIYLLPISLQLQPSVEALRRALNSHCRPAELSQYSVAAVAGAYLRLDAQRNQRKSIWISRRLHKVGE